MCSVLSLVFVSFKASFVFGASAEQGGEYLRASEVALFICSFGLAVGHIVVAYRTSCRERRKLWVYKIDIEAVSILVFSITPVVGHECHFKTRCDRKYPGKIKPTQFFVFIFGTQPTF